MASITRREVADGSGRWDVEYYVDGKRRQKTFDSARGAEDFEQEVNVDKRRGHLRDPQGARTLLAVYVALWIDAKGFPPGTRQRVQQRLDAYILPHLGHLQLGQIKAITIRSWITKLKGSNASKAVIFTHLSDILSCAVDDDLIPENVCKKKSVRQVQPRAPLQNTTDVWEPEQVNEIHDGLMARYRILATLTSQLALRPGEAFGLAPHDVDYFKNVVHVRRELLRLYDGRRIFKLPKGDKERDVPLPAAVKAELAAHLARHPAKSVTHRWADPDDGKVVTVPLVITTFQGNSVDSSAFNSGPWRTALRKAGIEHVPFQTGPHRLRHYCGTAWAMAGYSIDEIQQWMGHADPAITLRIYSHVKGRPNDEALREMVADFHARRRMDGESGSQAR